MSGDHTMEDGASTSPYPLSVTEQVAQTSVPLHLDIRKQLQSFLGDIGYSSSKYPSQPISVPRIIFDYACSDDSTLATSELLDALSLLAAYEGISEFVLRRFEPILIDLLARWLDSIPTTDAALLERRLVVLASVAETQPSLWSLITSFLVNSPFAKSPMGSIPEDELLALPPARLHTLLLAYNRLLVADPDIATRYDWPLSSLHILRTEHPDRGVRLLAIKALAKRRKWGEDKRRNTEKELVGEVDKIDAQIAYGWELVPLISGGFEIKQKVADGWMLPILEARRVQNFRNHIQDHSFSAATLIPSSALCSRISVVADTLLLRSSNALPSSEVMHVPTSPTSATLQRLAPLLQLGLPILLTSPPSSGKTHILQYLSAVLFPAQHPTNRILTIPLADTSIDVKSLIGTYISSPTKPGSFEWMEGALAKAIRAGRWVVFEDVDRGSTEMLVTLSEIARSIQPLRPGRRARLAIPGRDAVEAGDGFALFATRTIRQGYVAPNFFGHHILTEVQLDAPSDQDILAILSARFHRLPPSLLTTLVRIWHQLRPFDKLSGQVKARDIGLRDLEKWCARVERNLPSSAALAALEQSESGVLANSVVQDEIFLEAVDIFVASLDNKGTSLSKRKDMTSVIASGLGLDDDRSQALEGRRPQLEISSASRQLHIGRIVMNTVPSTRREAPSSSRPFALTRPSLILLERIAVSLALGESTLLVGETGTGKTTAVQHIANIVRKPLTVLNLSMQTETSDLLGGFKPIDASISARNLHSRWQKLFCETFSMAKSQNGAYVEAASRALSGRKWARCAELWASSARRAIDKLGKGETDEQPVQGSPMKRRKITKATKFALQWQALLVDITDFDLHHVKMNSKLVFSFVEGPLVKAMISGEWILLDEVNLASQETLEAISTVLEGPTASLVLTERGDVEPITRHPEFRLFACMNPATDVGKKDLPPNLRARFTELYVPPPDDDREALIAIVSQYLGDAAAGDKAVILDVAELYTTLKRLSAAKEIVDGSNAPPHYSMRTLARALTFAVESAPLFGLRRGLWEGYLMAFTMSLDGASAKIAHEAGERFILAPMKNARAVLAQIPSLPSSMDPDDFIRFGPFWLQRGPLPPTPESRYVITPSVQAKLSDLARVILTKRYPVLIQGPTSAGKTSAVEFLARQTGHRFVRINNHEHTDIQEYLGTYVTDPKSGNLVFQEGLLVTAVRQGHWIVLDELNLAPTDVLEALNRLLDDNRELVIPETQEVIKPHPNFILFATQNPPGLYAGRKVLSRAFRNRFLEVHFDDVPKDELETILCQRCQIAPSYARRIVQVFEELRHRRQASRVFESKQSFATLRDLFRWAERGAVGYQQLAEDGYMLLAERARQDEDKIVIKQVIQGVMKVTIQDDMYSLFDQSSAILSRLPMAAVPKTTMVWTKAMQRLFALVAAALAHNEPVLLVGETGCGKTSVCEVIAHMFGQQLVGVNCHQNMETADLLGSQRPVRNRLERRAKVVSTLSQYIELSPSATDDEIHAACISLSKREDVDQSAVTNCQMELKQLSALFEWSDGPLVHAMTAGDLLLLDEVSLADDSVLERLNSVLEPGRTLVLAEKGGVDIDEATIVAHDSFHVVATMNPGGDFGKKELSPALRNRFTEIWVPALNDKGDLLQIIEQSCNVDQMKICGSSILDYFVWFGEKLGDSAGLGLRDILAWVSFSSDMYTKGLQPAEAFHHGGQMVLIDGIESLPQIAGMSTTSITSLRQDCLSQLDVLASTLPGSTDAKQTDLSVKINPDSIAIGNFAIPRGAIVSETTHFRFEAPTTALNAMRLLRGCQLPKAILLEGSPGVGKTSLVSALAALAGHRLQRINLSDQTDLIDLFGSDLPVEGGAPGEFQWRDAAFLDAMQKGDWVLLDEMNLASQTVLEGLNAVLDHRGTVFIPELGKAFDRHTDFRVFAAQNPLQQGGGRKGLPKSFLNRFTKVYLQEHTAEDLMIICRGLHPLPADVVEKMIAFNEAMREQTMVTRLIGREGSPWEFNLRDLFRWFSLLSSHNGLQKTAHPAEYFAMVYRQRFRNDRDRLSVTQIFETILERNIDMTRPTPLVTPSWLQIGHSLIRRNGNAAIDVPLRHHHLPIAESVLKGIELGWLLILAGDSGAGKRSLVHGLAEAAGRELGEFAMHPGVDTSEILGSFEQQDVGRLLDAVYHTITHLLESAADAQPAFASFIERLFSARFACADTSNIESITTFIRLAEDTLVQLSTYIDIGVARRALDNLVRAGPNAVGFAWIDGQLIHAIKNGGWFLISDANLCSASVLDRLNSLCETNGTLVLSEKGSSTGTPEILKPHKDFRLFMTYDPRHGELSRAMRNRGVELYVDSPTDEQKKDVRPLSLNDDSLLGSIELHQPTTNAGESMVSASEVANIVALQSQDSKALLQRFSQISEQEGALYALASEVVNEPQVVQTLMIKREQASTRQSMVSDFESSLPFDISLNPNVQAHSYAVFTILQLILRNEVGQRALQQWFSNGENGKSVLATSAAAARRGPSRSKHQAGNDVYPFTSLFRDTIRQLPLILEGLEADKEQLDRLERICIYVQLIEDHAKSTVFDYSSTRLLAGWLEEELKHVKALVPLLDRLQGLAKTVQLSTGLGQTEIWTLFRDDDQGVVKRLTDSAAGIRDPELRLSILQALFTMRTHSPSSEATAELESLIAGSAATDNIGSRDDGKWTNWSVLSAIELSALRSNSQEALAVIMHDRHSSIGPLLPLQRNQGSFSTPAIVFQALSSWLARMWEHDTSTEKLGGPADLFKPVRLAANLRFALAEGVKMVEIPEQDDALRFSVKAALWSASRVEDRRSVSLHLAVLSIASILSAFGLDLPMSTLSASTLLKHFEDAALASDNKALSVYLNDLTTRRLMPALSSAVQSPSNLSTIGQLWLAASRLLLDIYVTNIPIDPAVRRALLGEVLDCRLTLVKEELIAVERAEVVTKGISDSQRVGSIRERLEKLREEKSLLGTNLDRPSDAVRLSHLFNEVHSFLQDPYSDTRTSELASALWSGKPQAFAREKDFQLASAAFIHRLEANYTDMIDLVRPIVTAVQFGKFGLRLLARNAELQLVKIDETVASALTFPMSANSEKLQHASTDQTNNVSIQLLAAAAHLSALEGEQRAHHLPTMMSRLDHLYQTWSTIRLREQQEAQASESLYRVKKTDVEVLSDQEQEEKEFAELFPQFEDAGAEDARPPTKSETKADRKGFSPSHVATFKSLIQHVFGKTTSSSSAMLKELVDGVLDTSFDSTMYDEQLDETSTAYQISILHRRQIDVKTSPVQANFYLSPNEPEIRKAHVILLRLLGRLNRLIDEWPEQMVLQHIRERCERVLALDVRSSVANILSAMELLLVHTEDWEGYASRENSLVGFRDETTRLIIEWRRLELASWMRLLDDQAAQFEAQDDEWTMRLYGALIHGSVSSTDIVKHINEVLPMITTYLQSSTLGQFTSRLDLISNFQQIASDMSTHVPNLSNISIMLHNVLSNARLFQPKASDSLTTQRAVVDKAIKDFVRLASWKDVNVYALKASAVKSHRQLHRSVRKFREILRQPMAPILAELNSICPQDSTNPSANSSSITPIFDISSTSSSTANAIALRAQAEPAVPAHLIRLDETFNRYSQVHTQARGGLAGSCATRLEDMSIDIIETAAALAKSTPSTMTKENTKIINNLASRKRKAYSDLLKALRASGFSQNVRADQLINQHSTTWMTIRPPLKYDVDVEGLSETEEGIAKIDKYHYKMGVLMIALRTAFNGHNPDIASQDLQRGIGYTESIFATALTERDRLTTRLNSFTRLYAILSRLRHCSQASSLAGGETLLQSLLNAESSTVQIHNSLCEVEEGMRQLRELQNTPIRPQDLSAIHELRTETSLLLRALSLALKSASQATCAIFTQDEVALLDTAMRIRQKLIDSFSLQLKASPDFRHLLQPVIDLAISMSRFNSPMQTDDVSSNTWMKSDELIQALLVIAQQLKTPTLSSEVKEDEYPSVPADFKEQTTFSTSLRTDDVVDRIVTFVQTLTANETASTVAPSCLARITPFLDSFAESVAQSLSTHLYAVKSTYKLAYVVGRIMLDLAQKGFCKPSEESDDAGGDGDGDTVEGTGMGAGTGEKNVSSEIKEESQVEGLQGEEEEEEQEKQGGEDDDDAFSMDEDFEGKMEDGKEKEEGEGSDDESDEEDHDEQVGDVDPLDPGAVDEKFWGDEKEEEQKEQGGDELMDQKTQEQGESEMAAKEKEGTESKDKDKKEEKDQEQGKEDDGEQAQEGKQDSETGGEEGEGLEDEQDAMGEQEEDEEGEDQPAGQDQTQVNVPEGENLELPDDLNLDQEGSDGDQDDNLDDGMSLSGGEEEDHPDNDRGDDDISMADQDDGQLGPEEEAPPATGQGEEDTEEEAGKDQNLDVSASKEQAQETDVGKGVSGGIEGESKQDEEKDAEKGEKQDDDIETQAQGNDGAAPQSQQQLGSSNDDQQADGPVDSSGAPLPSNDNSQPQASRSLGDILKEIRRRRDEILAQQEREAEPSSDQQQAQEEAPGQVEYLNDDQAKEEDMQALGKAGEEERQKLQDLNIVDDEEGRTDQRGIEDDDLLEDNEAQGEDRPRHEYENAVPPQSENDIEREREEKALTQADIGGASGGPSEEAMDIDEDGLLADGIEANDVKPDIDTDADELELTIHDAPAVCTDDTSAEDLWRKYASMTSDLSYALCEQLRLILEPTLATRLQGDFRTGKRLNMRKIIPYIASEYTKDKIWLRRTKPSRREYQVLLSLDDSRSMSESHSVDLAYQTLALVSQAMNKLEVGQVSIAKFGEGVDILHPFKESQGGFTESDGAKIMSSFKFDQHKTDVAALVERTLSYLAEARSGPAMSSTAPDLWQLQIIISDGVCQDHQKLRRLLRKALEERVMIVFIIVDSLNSNTQQSTATAAATSNGNGNGNGRPSILSMQNVEYKMVNGEMKLEMNRYLDTFPFEFYVVLRDVEALPGVLADTLRQWMARVSQSQE